MNYKLGLLLLFTMHCLGIQAQQRVLHVKMETDGGTYTASGEDWDHAISDLQVAINQLHEHLLAHPGETAAVYVAEGTYRPTQNLDDYFRDGNNATIDMAFIVYEGITIYGGFPRDGSIDIPSARPLKSGGDAWDYQHATVLSGSMGTAATPRFVYNTSTGAYAIPSVGSSNHVVWFATKATKADEESADQYAPLTQPTGVDGCIVEGGYANSRTTAWRDHTAYGGGAYMVEGSTLRGCIVRRCAATLRGGGIYMDGGGLVDHCLVEECQAAGVGITDGYGGGICADYGGTVVHSIVTRCSARIGGGLALCYETARRHGAAQDPYDMHAAGVIVSNCSSTSEAGGVFLSGGGTLNHASVVRCRNFGIDVTIAGRRFGRSGGIYINNAGVVYNSVVWGNLCSNNNDVQYAAYTHESTATLRPQVAYCAVAKQDITDWTGTLRTNVYAVTDENTATTSTALFPAFRNPTTQAGPADETAADWTPTANSRIISKGVQVTDHSDNTVLRNAHLTRDYRDQGFSPVSTLGALASEKELMRGTEDITTSYTDAFPSFSGAAGQKLLTIFVDPSHLYTEEEVTDGVGYSWDHPVNSLSKAIQIAFEWRSRQRYDMAGTDDDKGYLPYTGPEDVTNPTGTYLPVQILVKEGQQMTGGPSSFQEDDLRSGCIRPINDLHVYGGFPATLTGTDTAQRNPKEHPSRLNSNLINSSTDNWATHVISLTNVQNVTFDGFQLYYGAATNTDAMSTQVGSGGGIIVSNNSPVWEKSHGEPKIPQTGNLLRNCVIANCYTDGDGSAVYVNGGNTDSDITLENCIIHNNRAIDKNTGLPVATFSALGGSTTTGRIVLNHCNIQQNEGYPFRTKGVTANTAIVCTNSIIFANTARYHTDLNGLGASEILTIYPESENIRGSYCLFDNGTTLENFTNSRAVLTYSETGNTGYTYPLTTNPTTTIGLSETGDATKFGGAPDWTPQNMSPVVNAAGDDPATPGTDFTLQTPRNRGGRADIGAIENTEQPEFGKVLYVTPEGSGDFSGTSWSNAIAGNYVYDVTVAPTASPWNVDNNGTKVPTTDNRYQGGRLEDNSTSYPFGEQSGFSKDFWATNTQGTNDEINISNTRYERYVSGLQYAVEQAASTNDGLTDNYIQVWVGNGTYTDHKGYIIRNKVSVYGGFPASSGGSPGMNERVALVSSSVPKDDALSDEEYARRISSYETILQVSATSPTTTSSGFNSEVGTFASGSTILRKYVLAQPDVCLPTFSPTDVTTVSVTTSSYNVRAVSDDKSYKIRFNNNLSLGYNNGKCQIQTNTASEYQEWRFLKVAEYPDYYFLYNVGADSYLTAGTVNNWTLQFLKKDQLDNLSRAMFKFEGSRILCYHNKKYLAPDNTTDGSEVYYDKASDFRNSPTWSIEENTSNNEIIEVNHIIITPGGRTMTGENASNTYRFRPEDQKFVYRADPRYIEFSDVLWDGFTIQHGFMNGYGANRDGGAGVRLFRGVELQNCIIRDNYNYANRGRGGGIYLDGDNSRIVSCYVLNNTIKKISSQVYGGGAYIIFGTSYNSLYANNYADDLGSGVFIEGGLFYNNTIAYNEGIGLSHWTDSQRPSYMELYNCLIYGNTGKAVTSTSPSLLKEGNFRNNYINTTSVDDKLSQIITSTYSNEYATNLTNPFRKGDEARSEQDYRLGDGSPCINAGQNEPSNYDGTKVIQLPSYDVAYTDRIQDCTVDIGAYEYNGATNILPTVTDDGIASFFVTYNGAGTASGGSASNPACWQKLQKVLDAAGRYKYQNPGRQVVVRLASEGSNAFVARRSSARVGSGRESNPRTWSIMVPRGVEVWGGYEVNADGTFASSEATRDILGNRTTLSGSYLDESTGQFVDCYHVVTFTDQLFDADGKVMDGELSDVASEMGSYGRSVLDGLFISGGNAAGNDSGDRQGGGAIVTGYAHVRNCIVTDNSADDDGGGLYLQSQALVSGCVVKNNTAARGGGIAVEEPADIDETTPGYGDQTYAHLISCTLVNNNATETGGGIYFINNLRANSCVFWQNSSPDQGNVAGRINTERDQKVENYPLSYCAVEALRAPGVNNISVASDQDKGVRWQNDTNQEDYLYFRVTRASDLARTGMSYALFEELQARFPSLTSTDIAGLKRMKETEVRTLQVSGAELTTVEKDNQYTEIGARVINADLHPDVETNVLRRLFVSHTENINTEVANTLAAGNDPVYRQKGSSFANPMIRLGDAFDYICNARKNNPDLADTRFEVFIAAGTYYPYHDVNGSHATARNATFAVPEGVTVVGGIDIKGTDAQPNYYCQETSGEVQADGISLRPATTDAIRTARKRYDVNQNSVNEPWEMEQQTILSGLSASDDDFNLYHIITCLADPDVVGTLPRIDREGGRETAASQAARTIIIDGVTISDGSARRYTSDALRKQMYYRGGGIMVDGNWTDADDDTQDTAAETERMDAAARNIPLLLANCSFLGNSAVQGGAIFTNGDLSIFGCSFAQNIAESPSSAEANTAEAVNYIKDCGGGAIALGGSLLCVNTIFANNEARLYKGALSQNAFWTAPDEAGWGGAVWAGAQAETRMVNCDVVCNKAVAYPALYNIAAPAPGAETPAHFATSTIYWGNEVDAGQQDKERAMNFGSSTNDALFFCAYEAGFAPTATAQERNDRTAYRQTAFDGDFMGRPASTFSFAAALGGHNHNLIINEENDNALNGPRFTFPARGAGYDNYLPSADWFIYRFNGLCDNGWTTLDQRVENEGSYYRTEFLTDGDGRITGSGIYKTIADVVKQTYDLTLMPYGDDTYMEYASGVYAGRPMKRISSDPEMGSNVAFIDIGVYEYQHIQLELENASASEVDCIWVAETENIQNGASGLHFDCPTSKLQRAINTLLLSRNGHDKEVRIITGTYTPTAVSATTGMLAITIDVPSNPDAVLMPIRRGSTTRYGINSLTLRGGYSGYNATDCDPELYPVVFEMQPLASTSDDQTQHLVDIVNAENEETSEDDRVAHSTTGRAIPVIIEGITFRNMHASAGHEEGGAACNGGAAINYRNQYKANADGQKTATLLDAPEGGRPKLTIRRCKFVQNGVPGVAAVTIGQGGGEALVYNTLMHSNLGNTVEATGPVSLINVTSALNGGHLVLSDGCRLHNSIIWRDDRQNGGATQFEGIAIGSSMTHNAVTGIDSETDFHNDRLSGDNNDIVDGPNFQSPAVDATSADDIFRRSFSINPSIVILRKADAGVYERLVIGAEHGASAERDWINYTTLTGDERTRREAAARQVTMNHEYWEMVTDADGNPVETDGMLLFNILDASGTVVDQGSYEKLIDKGYTFDMGDHTDLGGNARYSESGMERGAYECQAHLRRVVYADPATRANSRGGDSWQNAYGRTQLQSAIDAAAVYANLQNTTAFVFMRSLSGGTTTGETLTFRDGVQVYGSISGMQQVEDDEGNLSEADADIARYIEKVTTGASGYRTPLAVSNTRTSITGLSTAGQTFSKLSLFDGFEVSSGSTAATPVTMEGSHVVLRGSIVSGCAPAEGAVVKMSGGALLYNVLLRDNTTAEGQPLVSLTDDDYALNCTATTADAFGGSVGNALNCVAEEGFAPFAPYLHGGQTAYNADFDYANRNLWYQLREGSTAIDSGDDDADDRMASFRYTLDGVSHSIVSYADDLDLLGNPRRIGSVDRGCYETWQAKGTLLTANTTAASYHGQHYPHTGSVVYLMDGGSLVMTPGHFPAAAPLQPAFLLMKDEAGGLYVQGDGTETGNHFQCSHVALERAVAGRYALVALPFRSHTTAITTGDPATTASATAYTYDSERRARWHGGFHYKEEGSDLWNVTSGTLPAGSGWLLVTTTSGTYRFNGIGRNSSDFVYSESGPKTVTLTQHDDRTSTAGDASFTRMENMGWNLVGMPYLVGSYATARETGGTYAMHVPHMLYTIRATGQYAAQQSWADATTVGAGEGFFTQTAVTTESETLTFRLPPLPAGATPPAGAAPRLVVTAGDEASSDWITLMPQAAETPLSSHGGAEATVGAELVSNSQLSDRQLPNLSGGIKWAAVSDEPLVALYVTDASGLPLQLLSATPTDCDIPLCVEDPSEQTLTFRLADGEAYSAYEGVWLTDQLTGLSYNLLREEATLLSPGELAGGARDASAVRRLTLRIAGAATLPASGRASRPGAPFKAAARGGRIALPNTQAHNQLTVTQMDGRTVFSGTAEELSRHFLPDGVYIVSIAQ